MERTDLGSERVTPAWTAGGGSCPEGGGERGEGPQEGKQATPRWGLCLCAPSPLRSQQFLPERHLPLGTVGLPSDKRGRGLEDDGKGAPLPRKRGRIRICALRLKRKASPNASNRCIYHNFSPFFFCRFGVFQNKSRGGREGGLALPPKV